MQPTDLIYFKIFYQLLNQQIFNKTTVSFYFHIIVAWSLT